MEKYLNIDCSSLGYFLQIKCPPKSKKQDKQENSGAEEVFEVTKQNIERLKK